jgi:plastocyanin
VLQGFRFWPETVTARPGQTWTVENRDVAVHRLRTLERKGGPAIDSGDRGPGTTNGSAGPSPADPSTRITMPAQKGTYRAECPYHGKMTITVVVS